MGTKKNKKKSTVKKHPCDGYIFDSKLELEHYIALRDSLNVEILNVHPQFELIPKLEYRRIPDFRLCSMDNMVYTPDFLLRIPQWDRDIILETKGRVTEGYRMRKKIFLSLWRDTYYFFVAKKKEDVTDFVHKVDSGYYEKKAKRAKKSYTPITLN